MSEEELRRILGPLYDETNEQRNERINKQARRDHPFEGTGQYCEARIGFAPMGNAETGQITGWHGCGYPKERHPKEETC